MRSAAISAAARSICYATAVALDVAVPGVERAVAEDLVARAHIVCPYSHATRNGLDVRLTIV